jgi:hypothetical protein
MIGKKADLEHVTTEKMCLHIIIIIGLEVNIPACAFA